MKRVAMLSALVIPLLVVAGFIMKDKSKTKEPAITFYKTPLVCNAAPDIGCGSRAKPALLELEKNPAVKEAWLNRPGTVVAIVWKDREQTEAVAKPIFENASIDFTELEGSEVVAYKKTFRKTNLWYRSADVDALSKEEAAKIKTDVEAYFKKELIKLRTNEELNDDSQNKFRDDLYKIAEKYIGKERTEKAMKLYEENCEKQCKEDGGCTTPGTKKSCCDKN